MDLFDFHCDTASRMLADRGSLLDGPYQVTLEKAQIFDRWAQVFAVFIRDGKSPAVAQEDYRAQTASLKRAFAAQNGQIRQCRTAKELDETLACGLRAAVLSVENGSALGGTLDTLPQLAADGVRLLTLTWFGENDLGFGSVAGGPLKPFGRAVVDALPQYGIVPDVSHLSDEGVAEVFARYGGPVAATHSNVRSVTGHCRNLTDSQICEIVRRGGIIGLNLYRAFLSAEASCAGLDDMYRHIDAFLSLGAQNALCMGADLDGGGGTDDVGSVADLPRLYEYLLQRNLPQQVADAIFFENANQFWHRVL